MHFDILTKRSPVNSKKYAAVSPVLIMEFENWFQDCKKKKKNHLFFGIFSAPKIMPPVLLCQLIKSEVAVGDMAAEVEPSHQYPITCCYCVTDGSRGAV